MMSCWQNEPEARPAFTVLTKQLRKMENQHKVRFNVNIKSDELSFEQSSFFFLVLVLLFRNSQLNLLKRFRWHCIQNV